MGIKAIKGLGKAFKEASKKFGEKTAKHMADTETRHKAWKKMGLKGPMDMLQLYEQKYQTEVQKFGAEQIGRRRRDDYTDGEPRIPVQSPAP